jgi:polygalacturonase
MLRDTEKIREIAGFNCSPDHRAQAILDGVEVTDIANSPKPYTFLFDNADVTYGPGGSNLKLPTASNATVTGSPSEAKPHSCAGRFVPFPN